MPRSTSVEISTGPLGQFISSRTLSRLDLNLLTALRALLQATLGEAVDRYLDAHGVEWTDWKER